MKRISLYIPDELHKALLHKASKDNRSLNAYILLKLNSILNRYKAHQSTSKRKGNAESIIAYMNTKNIAQLKTTPTNIQKINARIDDLLHEGMSIDKIITEIQGVIDRHASNSWWREHKKFWNATTIFGKAGFDKAREQL